jgi:dCTP diphosphatase
MSPARRPRRTESAAPRRTSPEPPLIPAAPAPLVRGGTSFPPPSPPARDFAVLEERVRRFRDERDWRRFHTPKDLALSVALEAAELLEHFQWRTDAETSAELASAEKRREVGREMADVLILLVSAADVIGVDLYEATLRKIEENARKYPVDRARGRADKYDRL